MPKFLIIRFSSIGDIVLTTPVIRWIKQQIPGAEIHYLTKKSFAGIPEYNPYISKIFAIQKTTRELLAELKKEEYDYIIDLHNNLRSLTVKTFLQVQSYSVKKYHFQRLQMVWFKNRKPFAGHVVERYLSVLQPLGIKNDLQGLDYFLPPAEQLKKVKALSLETGKYLALVVGAKHFTKRLPIEKLEELIGKVSSKVVLLGGKEDASTGEWLVKKFPEKVLNLCGKISLHESALMLREATLVVSHDTGLMHIAAAFNKKIISVWGGTVPELGMTPWMPQHPEFSTLIENKELKCRPCSKIGRNSCPEKHFRCMQDIPVQQMVSSIQKQWQE